MLLGAAVGAAVLGGALLVGDSLRGSLHERTERQLGNVDNVLVASRFLREDLPGELPGAVRGALLLQGTVRAGEQRIGKVTVWGVNDRFIDLPKLATAEPVRHPVCESGQERCKSRWAIRSSSESKNRR